MTRPAPIDDEGDLAAPRGRRPWSLERKAWVIALVLCVLSALLMHVGKTPGATWAKAVGDLLVGLSLAMVVAGGREGGYGERGTLPLAVGVAVLAPLVGYASDPHGVLGRAFGTLEFFVLGMAVAALVVTVNRKLAGPSDRDDARDRGRPTPLDR